jgi:DNA polymerase III subunit epsilon
MPPWFEGPLAAFDTKTTGTDAEQDRIVSAALVVQRGAGSAPDVRQWLVSPGIPVPPAATRVHGLTDTHLRHGRWPSPVMEEVARALAEQSARGTPLVVMSAPFHLTLLDRELRRHRNSTLVAYLSGCSLCVLDPLVLDKHLDRYRTGDRTLAGLGAHYAVQSADARDAAADALAALEVVRQVGRRFATRIEGLSPAELHVRQAVWFAAQARGRQAWFARHGSDETCDPAWPLRPELPAAA